MNVASVMLLLGTVVGLHARRPLSDSAKCGAARVAITVSPLVRSKELRVLELSWSHDGARPGDQVALYDYDPVSRRQVDGNSKRNEPVSDSASDAASGTRGGWSEPAGATPTSGSRHLYNRPEGDDYRTSAGTGYPGGSADGYRPSGGSGVYSPGEYSGVPGGYNPGVPGGYNPGVPGGYNPGVPGGYSPGTSGAYSPVTPDPYNPGAPGAYGPGASGAYNLGASGVYSGQYRPNAGAGNYNPNPYGGPGAGLNGGGGSPFPVGYPRDAFGGRARREADPAAGGPAEGEAGGGPPLAVVPTDGLATGWRATNVQERHTPSSQLGYKSRCLNYWAVYERPRFGSTVSGENQTEVLAVSCLRTRPTWMDDFRAEIKHLRLVDLFIPGSHDSASVQEDGRNNIIDKYTVTQDESVLGQLVYGVRYIDLRVGFYPSKDVQWWANHGPVRMQPLQSVLHEVKAFMDNTNEIVILDLQNFPAGFGKDNKIHLKLVHLLETELGELMAYRSMGWGARLYEMWESGRRLIVGYDKEDVLPASSKLWSSVRQFWGDAQTPEQLNKFASSILSQQNLHGFPWALMAELTPNARLIATNPTGSLRRLAHLVNRNVTAWAEGEWGENMHTLAVDFVRSTGVVEAAILHNLRRAGLDTCNAHRLLSSV